VVRGVPLKDAWARIEPHGRELRRMGAHGGAWTRTTAKGHALSCSSRSGLQSRDAETLNWREQEAFEDDSHQRDKERHRMDAHDGEWKRTQRMHGHELQRNAMNNCHAIAGRTVRCRCASLPVYINDCE